MSERQPVLRLFLDEGVPDSVGRIFSEAGHDVIYLRNAVAPGSPDQLVCAVSEANDAILVALDADMKRLAQSRAAERVKSAMSLIEHEWTIGAQGRDRRIFIEIGSDVIRTMR